MIARRRNRRRHRLATADRPFSNAARQQDKIFNMHLQDQRFRLLSGSQSIASMRMHRHRLIRLSCSVFSYRRKRSTSTIDISDLIQSSGSRLRDDSVTDRDDEKTESKIPARIE
jgi:hypothetical protein